MIRWSLVAVAACSSSSAPPPPPKAEPPPVASRHHQWEPPPVTPGTKQKPVERPAPEPWPSGEFDLRKQLPSAFGTADKLGTKHRVVRAIADSKARWAIMCQQRRDTDGDGKIGYEQAAHFALGDNPSAWLVVGGGPGAEIDDILAISGEHIVLEIDGSTLLIELTKLTARVLPNAQGRAAFSPDHKRLVYLDEQGDVLRVVRHDLAAGTTRAVKLPHYRPGALLTDLTARWVAVVQESTSDSLERFYDWCSLSGSFGTGAPRKNRWQWVDIDSGTIRDDPTLVRPIGSHALTRDGNQLALDGKPIGPSGCDELDLLGIHEPNTGVLALCLRRKRFRFTVHYIAEGIAVEVEGQPDRAKGPMPPTLLEPTFCFRSPRGIVCLDLATGKETPGKWQGDPPWPSRTDRLQEYAFAGDQVLVGNLDENGPLWWEPRGKRD